MMSRRIVTALLAAGISAHALPAICQSFPARPVRLVVGYAPGGAADLISRLMAKGLTDRLGQQVIVDNRPGAGGFVGNEHVAKSPPDGHTLLLANASFAYLPALYLKLGFDTKKDFVPVARVASTQNLLVTHPAVPAKNVRELVALARANPGKLNYASGGVGGSTHLATELFKSMTGANIVHIPYKGNAPSIVDLISGQVDLTIAPIPVLLQHVNSGKLKALATTGAKRSPIVPNLPTVAESGVTGYDVGSWYGYVAPAKTPAGIVARLGTEMLAIVGSAEFTEQLKNAVGAEPSGLPSGGFARFIADETEKWGKVIKAARIKAD